MNLFLKKLKQNNFKFFLFCLLFVIFTGLFFLGNIFFKISTIKVFGKTKSYPFYGITDLKDNNILLLSIENTQKNLYKVNPAIKQVLIEKEFPHTLAITVEYFRPLAIFKATNGFFYLSESGRITLRKKEGIDKNLPIINFYQKIDFNSFSAGDNLDYKEILAALRYLKKVQDLGLRINTIDIIGTYMIGLNLEESKIIFSTEKDIDRQLMEFEAIIRQFKIQGQKFHKLDLRFDKPVVELN